MSVRILIGDVRDKLKELPDESVHCVVTSPPYFGLRDYGVAGQIGLEETPAAYVSTMVEVFREARRVLRKDGTLWLNLGNSYAGSGKGGNPEAGKQATNAGSQSIGVLYGTGKTAREAAVTNVMRKTWRNGSGRADGIVDGRGQRNRDGVGYVEDIKAKDLIGIPWMVAFALRNDGWYLRQETIWSKPNPMPESVTDRCTKAHECLFLLSKSERYFYDQEAIAELYSGITGMDGTGFKDPQSFNGKHKTAGIFGGRTAKDGPDDGTRNRRSVWTVSTQPFSEAHFATFPPALIEPCILAGCPKGGTVLDPFGGAGTTGLVADRLERNAILIELNPEYAVREAYPS